VAIVVGLLDLALGGAVVTAVGWDAGDRLGTGFGRRGLDKCKARLVVQGSRNGHLARAALLLLPGGPNVVDLLRGRFFDGDCLLPEAEETPARDLLLADGDAHYVGAAKRGTRGLRGGDLFAGDLDGMWLRVDAGGARRVEGMRGRRKLGGLELGPGLVSDGRSAGASCRHYRELLFEGREGRMLDPAGGGSKEEAESPLGRVIMMMMRVLDRGYRSEIDRGICRQ
jgi:hypothetical protein